LSEYSVDLQEMIAFIQNTVERGITFFDTPEVYGLFINEELVGEALEPFKGEIIFATKFGFNVDEDGFHSEDSRPERIRRVAEESLKRLRLISLKNGDSITCESKAENGSEKLLTSASYLVLTLSSCSQTIYIPLRWKTEESFVFPAKV